MRMRQAGALRYALAAITRAASSWSACTSTAGAATVTSMEMS